jgi:hypothetical protein
VNLARACDGRLSGLPATGTAAAGDVRLRGAEHRGALTSAYNQYMRCSADAAYAPARRRMKTTR